MIAKGTSCHWPSSFNTSEVLSLEMNHQERLGIYIIKIKFLIKSNNSPTMELVEIKLRIDSGKNDGHVMCVPDFHGCVRVCFQWRVERTVKSKILDVLTRLISFETHPLIVSKNRGSKPKPSQTGT